MSKEQILIAGHGGQGVLLLGDYIAYASMLQGKHVAFTPSYGPESRGGKAKCFVIISDEEVDNPIAEDPNVEIIMNQPSMEFLNALKPGGLIIYNRSLIDGGVNRSDVLSYGIPATEIAEGVRELLSASERIDTKFLANTVVFGAFIQLCEPDMSTETVDADFEHFLSGKKQALMRMNQIALEEGRMFVKNNPPPSTAKPSTPTRSRESSPP